MIRFNDLQFGIFAVWQFDSLQFNLRHCIFILSF